MCGSFAFDLRKGSDGGDRTLELVRPVPWVDDTDAPSLLEKKNMKKPMHRMPASTNVMGFWRLKERGVGMLATRRGRRCAAGDERNL